MAKREAMPAQHLQRQRQRRQHQLQTHTQQQQQTESSKCWHVLRCRRFSFSYSYNSSSSSSSWSCGCRRVAWLLAVVCLLTRPVMPEVIYRVDPLALLAATLRTYQRAGCDSEQLSLSCPRGTSISIELAQYGRAGDLSDHSLCPPVSQEDLTTTGSAGDAVIHSGTEIEVKPPETCTVSGLQYALLQTVVDACQKKRHCKFAANSKTHTSGDPCSGIRKFVEIAYKCRPYEFRSKLACENDNMPLMCNPYSRIAIYSATFGHTERESVQCGGQGAGATTTINREDNSKPTCLVSYATETVMQICHGRRRCSVTADAGTFGRPCKTDVRMYLKVVYTCIPRKVLKDRYETAPEADEPQQTDLDLDQDELYDEDQFYKESEAIPPAPKLQGANVGRSFDFDVHGAAAEDGIVTSTLLPPLLSRDDGALEASCALLCVSCALALEGSIYAIRLAPGAWCLALGAWRLAWRLVPCNLCIIYSKRKCNVEACLSSSLRLSLMDECGECTEQCTEYTNWQSFAARLQSSVRLLNRIKESFNQQSLAEVVANEHIITTSVEPRSDAANMDNEDKALDSSNETTTAEQEPELQTEQAATDGNFFYRRKCQMVDDWGPIGLNCTEEDIVTERVEVVGFLANWLHTYLHIRKHQEQFYLYLIISVTAGVLLCLTLVIGRLTLQKRGGRKKRSSSGNSGAGKGFAEAQIDSTESGGAGAGVAAGLATGETHLPDSFADDISDIDVDVDLTTPVPLSSLSARNETYMTYAPTPNCNYSTQQQQQQQHTHMQHPQQGMAMGHPHPHGSSSQATSVLMAPPPSNIYSSMAGMGGHPAHAHAHHPAVSGAMTIGPHHMQGAYSLSGVTPTYISGTIMVPGHQHTHAGTLRRTLIPTSMGLMSSPSPPPATALGLPPHSLASSSGSGGGNSIYYDSTVPRTLARGLSTESSAQYFYG
ncbi:uncharacterized protein LOC108603701 isoform X2 [Drosophila busckii]|uniref:uncharacterized protein LOC108603701 isoform X2 n=1 Tax=Drosophila busckii TaxID=30019 RepID=UPI00083EDB3D|nr:uncharacterized protein LOC108603701 isoform X2 [Drosophila busckii]